MIVASYHLLPPSLSLSLPPPLQDPHHFEPLAGKPLEELDAHCAEYVAEGEWMTSAGWGAGGVFLSKLNWTQ